MAFYDNNWYCNFGDGSTTGYYAVTVRPQNTAVAAGVLRRQFTAPAVGSERVFVCIVAGTTANTTDATWVLTRGAKTTDGTATWQECTGASAVNGDLTNTATWAQAKAIGTPQLGAIIQRNNGASFWICSTAGSMGASEPAWSNNTAGTTQADGTTTWTCLGVVGNFTGGQAPHARLASACASTWFASGNTIYVGENHAESQATAIAIQPVGGVAFVAKILCHNHSGNYPPTDSDLTTGATVSTSASVAINFTPSTGMYYVSGLTLKAGVGASGAGASISLGGLESYITFDKCSMQLRATGPNQLFIGPSNGPTTVILNNTTVYFGNAGGYVAPLFGNFTWQNTGQILESGSSIPTILTQPDASNHFANVVLEALDLSQISTAIFSTTIPNQWGVWLAKDCKLHASVTFAAAPPDSGCTYQNVRSDSGATAYKSSRYAYEGTETTETSITRGGGASDPTGQAQSRKIVTTANSQWLRPFKAEPYAIWNPTTAANVTVTVYGTINAGALPNNDDIWLEVEYLGSSATPLGTIKTTTKASVLAANAAVASDGSTWNNVSNYAQFDGTPSAGITLSNSNLTVTHGSTSASRGVASLALYTIGKYYFETTVQVSTTNSNFIGILLSTGLFSDVSGLQQNCTTIATSSTSSIIYSNNANSGKNLGVIGIGDVVGIAIDLTNRLAWFRKNGGNWNNDGTANPATGVGGVTIGAGSFAPFVSFASGAATDAFTANFGVTSYTNAAPFGFGNWPNGWSPFKLTTTLSSPQPGLAGYFEARVRVAKSSTTYYLDPKIVLS